MRKLFRRSVGAVYPEAFRPEFRAAHAEAGDAAFKLLSAFGMMREGRQQDLPVADKVSAADTIFLEYGVQMGFAALASIVIATPTKAEQADKLVKRVGFELAVRSKVHTDRGESVKAITPIIGKRRSARSEQAQGTH